MSKKSKAKPAVAQVRFRVRIPGFSGLHPTGVRFVDNVGHTDDPGVADNCRNQGFLVDEVGDEDEGGGEGMEPDGGNSGQAD